MESIIKTAKTVETAISEALSELNVDKDDVTIEVIDEPNKGFLGIIGSKDAKVKVTADKDPVYLANNFLNMLLEKMEIEAEPKISRKGKNLYIDIIGENKNDMGVIIGKRGKTLDSIQYLLNLVINKDRENYIRVLLDTEDYRKKREETLKRLAKRMAGKVKRIKKSVKLEPMNPYERRIIHSALQRDSYVETHSEGEEPFRKVVIELK
ncbi:MAG: protein jag [Firmicutes bacterium]|nr:protein jag [Bacillota bacterium]